MPTFLRMPKVQMALTLLLILITALITHPTAANILLTIFSLAFTIGSDLIFTYFRKKQLFIPHAAIVTGLILSLTNNPGLPWYDILLISAIAMGAKNFIRIGGNHIFNPAAIGLVVGGIILHQPVSWWAVSFQTLFPFTLQNFIFFIILLSPLLVSAYRMRRYGSISAFLISYTLLLSFNHFNLPVLLATLLNPTSIFFSIVMLPEPMTSPVQIKRQLLYGFIVSVLIVIGSSTLVAQFLPANLLPDGLLPYLLLGNLLFFRFK